MFKSISIKKIATWVTTFMFMVTFFSTNALFMTTSYAATQATYYVSPTGSDSNPGTLSQPFQTIEKARDVIRTINSNMTGDIYVYLRGGTYNLTSPIQFNTSDSGTNGYNVIYKAYTDETPTISGGQQVTGWTVHSGNIYKATLNRTTKLRELYVNGVAASMTSKTVTGQGGYGTFNIAGNESWAETSGSTLDGIKFNASDVGIYSNPSDVELAQNKTWNQNIVCARDIISSDGYTAVLLQQPYGAISTTLCSGCNLVANSTFKIQNAFELLNSPGQFYFNRSTNTLYYYAKSGEDMSTATVIAPTSQGLIQIYGTSTSSRVKNLQFYGLNFTYDDWLLKDVGGSKGFSGVQSASLYTKFRSDGQMFNDDFAMCDLPQATIELKNCDSCRFERNTFTNLASAIAISLTNDVINTTVIGNKFTNLMGNAVNVGHPQHVYIGDGPLYPNGVEGVCYNDVVSNNLVRKVSKGYNQIEGITAFFVDTCTFTHNDVANVPYCAMSVGWGWSSYTKSTTCKNNTITYNKLGKSHQVLPNDGGTLYTLGQQPNSTIAYNYLYNGPRLIYLDEGTQNYSVHDNVTENAKPDGGHNNLPDWLYIWTNTIKNNTINNNYTNTNSTWNNGTNCPVTNTNYEASAPSWSSAAQSIIDNAGLEPAYQDLLISISNPSAFSGTYKLVNVSSGKCLDVDQNSTEDGAAIDQWTDNGGKSQKWNIVDAGDGCYNFVNVSSKKCLDVFGNSTDDGGKIAQWMDNGGSNQKWNIVDAGSGYYKLVSVSSGKCLNVHQNSIEDGATIDQWTDNGDNNQKWKIIKIN